MAKAKKPEGDSPAPKKNPAAAPKARTKSHKPAVAAGAVSMPLVDTSAAAQAVAASFANKAAMGQATADASGGNAPAKESAAFKQMKESLSKPSTQGLSGILGPAQTQKKSASNFGGGKQVGRNQTFGADVNRTGVPRRTSG